jgi:hypothetical protein
MKVKNLIERLKRFDQNKEIVFYNDQLENMWECDIEDDACNNDDVVITTYNEETNQGFNQALDFKINKWGF